MPMTELKEHRLLRVLMDLQGHLITFRVKTPGSRTGQMTQTPVLLLKDLTRTSEGRVCLRGIDTKKVKDPDAAEEGVRHYRLDRILSGVYDLGRMVDSTYLDPPVDAEGYVAF